MSADLVGAQPYSGLIRGRELLIDGRVAEATRAAKQLVVVQPSVAAFELLVDCHLAAGDRRSTKTTLRAMYRRFPSDPYATAVDLRTQAQWTRKTRSLILRLMPRAINDSYFAELIGLKALGHSRRIAVQMYKLLLTQAPTDKATRFLELRLMKWLGPKRFAKQTGRSHDPLEVKRQRLMRDYPLDPAAHQLSEETLQLSVRRPPRAARREVHRLSRARVGGLAHRRHLKLSLIRGSGITQVAMLGFGGAGGAALIASLTGAYWFAYAWIPIWGWLFARNMRAVAALRDRIPALALLPAQLRLTVALGIASAVTVGYAFVRIISNVPTDIASAESRWFKAKQDSLHLGSVADLNSRQRDLARYDMWAYINLGVATYVAGAAMAAVATWQLLVYWRLRRTSVRA
ncbi:MAG: hypothetical protein HY826_08260 [Actinobacteria bacterium]|nr:hypothetical protein [Actinomycetota bacterium]